MEKLHSQPLIFCATTVACQVPCRCEGFQSLAAALPTPARGNIDGLPRGFKVQGPNVTPIPWQDWQDWQDDCPASFCIEMKSSNDASLPFSLAPAALLFFSLLGYPAMDHGCFQAAQLALAHRCFQTSSLRQVAQEMPKPSRDDVRWYLEPALTRRKRSLWFHKLHITKLYIYIKSS